MELTQKNKYIGEAVETVYQLTQEEKIRMQCEAREDYYRTQLGWQDMLQEKEDLLKRMDDLLEEKNVLLGEKDVQLGEKDALLGEKDVLLEEKDNVIQEQQTAYEELLAWAREHGYNHVTE